MGRVLPRFIERHPKVEVEIRVENQFVNIVAEGLDAGIRLSEAVVEEARKALGISTCSSPTPASRARRTCLPLWLCAVVPPGLGVTNVRETAGPTIPSTATPAA